MQSQQSSGQETLRNNIDPTDLSPSNAKLYDFDAVDPEIAENIGGKAKNLVIMRRAGLPVPEGYCVPFDSYVSYLEEGVLEEGLVEEITAVKAMLGGKVAIRSSANCEDGSELSMAGVFETFFVEQDEDVAAAVTSIYDQASSTEVEEFMRLHGKTTENIKMGLVIQRLVVPEVAGVIYTDVNDGELLVEYVNGYGSTLVDGETQGSSMLIDDDGLIHSSVGYEEARTPKDMSQQVAELTRRVKELFGKNQDIEFAFNGTSLFVVQARPLTASVGRIELAHTPEDSLRLVKKELASLAASERRDFGTTSSVFSDANYSELLPRPTEMDIGIHMYVWGGSDGIPGAKQLGHQAMGYKVPKEATGMISYIGGHTYFSLARNAALYHIGFPETTAEYFSTLIPEYLETAKLDPEKAAYPQMGLFLQDPSLDDLRERFGDRAEEYLDVYQEFSDNLRDRASSFIGEFYGELVGESEAFLSQIESVDIEKLSDAELVEHALEILEHVRTVSYINFVNGARLGFYYSQRLQTLLNNLENVEDAESVFSLLSQGMEGSAITDANLAIADADSMEAAYEIARSLVGHFSGGEMLEIRHNPLINDPEKLRAYVEGIRSTGTYRVNYEKQRAVRIKTEQELLDGLEGETRDELAEAMEYSQTYMALRETTKYQFTREYLPLRNTLEAIGKRVGLSEGDIYFVYPRELPDLASDPGSMQHLINSRKQAFENNALLDMPSVITDADIDNIGMISDSETNFTKATGKLLASGEAHEGVIVNVDEFEDIADVNQAIMRHRQRGQSVILAAEQMNLSHDPLIVQASGLILRNAGFMAHGAQRAREHGTGAIGGVSVRALTTGTRVLFDPANRSIEKIDEETENE